MRTMRSAGGAGKALMGGTVLLNGTALLSGTVLLTAVAGCSAAPQQPSVRAAVTHSAGTAITRSVTSPPTSVTASTTSVSPTSAAPPATTASPTSAAPPATTASPTTPRAQPSGPPGDACSLVPVVVVRSALGATGVSATASSQGGFDSCQYAATSNSGHGTLYLDYEPSRGRVIYQQALASPGFASVDGVADRSAYNAADGRFIVLSGDAFVGLTLPVQMTGSTVTTPAGGTRAAVTIARAALDNSG
ncbi:MAG: hypothetical protein ACR2JQ_02155 [Mycobacteriales bacterium]